jgi:hypothetical protein
VQIERAAAGIGVSGAGSVGTIEDVRVSDGVRPAEPIYAGAPALAVHDAHVTVRRASFARTVATAVGVGGELAHLVLEDVAIRDARSNPMGFGFGLGIWGDENAVIEGSRVVVERAEGTDLLLSSGAGAHLTDAVLRDGRSVPDTLRLGHGVSVQLSSTLDLERVVVDGHHGFGLIAVELANITGRDVRVAGTRAYACEATTCADNAAGTAVVSTGLSRLRLERFIVDGADLCGVMVARSSSLDLLVGEVSGTEIGACVQIPGYDTARLSNGVAYRGNVQNLQATTLPVPEPTMPSSF